MRRLAFALLFACASLPAVARKRAPAPSPPIPARAPQPLDPVLLPLTDDALFREAFVGLQVVRVEDGEEVWSWQPDAALAPASVMKVLTSATALRALGPDWRFETAFYRDGEIDEEGVLKGDLYVRGTGDPTMVVEKLWKMIGDLQVEGIVEIGGHVIFDDTYMDGERLIKGWDKPLDLSTGPSYFAPLGALSVNYNTVSIVVAPGKKVGDPARVEQETPSDHVEITSEVKTGPVGSRAWTRIEREIDPATSVLKFKVEGQVPLDAEVERHYRAVADPMAYYTSVFKEVAKARGLKVKGRYKTGRLPADAERVVRLVSPPLSEILNHTNKLSSNFMAEQVLKAVGAEVHGTPGTTDKGLRVMRDYLSQLGLAEADYTLVNGSGLSRDIWLRPTQINAVLLDMYTNWTLAPEFVSSLAVGGVDGTLRRRFDGEDEAGRVRGKTGSIDGVYCLAGYVQAGDGEMYAFTFLVNGFRRVRPVRALQDRFGEAMLAMSDVAKGPVTAAGGGEEGEEAGEEAEEEAP